jgi:hypothetical protein
VVPAQATSVHGHRRRPTPMRPVFKGPACLVRRARLILRNRWRQWLLRDSQPQVCFIAFRYCPWLRIRRSVSRKLLGWRRHTEPLLPAARPQLVGRHQVGWRLIERAETDRYLAIRCSAQGRPARWAEMAGHGRVFPNSRLTVNRDVFRAPDCIGGDRRAALLPACRAVAQPDPDWLTARLNADGSATT